MIRCDTLQRTLLTMASVAFLFACAETAPSRFYTLSSLSDPATDARNETAAPLAIGVEPVTLPSYLDRPQVVRRTSANELDVDEFDKWAAPLGDIFLRVLAENLSLLLATDDVFVLPRRHSRDVDYEVSVEVHRFDADTTGQAVLSARWEIFGRDGKSLLKEGKSTVSEVASKPDDEAVIAAMSQTVADLSKDIAAAIRSLPRHTGPAGALGFRR